MTKFLTKEEARAKLKRKLRPSGKFLRLVGAIRVYDNGDGLGAVFHWWHPFSWLMFITFIPICAFIGVKITEAVPFRVERFFREHPDRLQWL